VSRWGVLLLLFSAPMNACGEAPLDAVTLPPGVGGVPLSSGLLGHWPLDEVAGALAQDDSGAGHDGQVDGATWLADGRLAGALRLTGGDSVSVAGVSDSTSNFTVAAWIRVSPAQLAMDSQPWVAILSTEAFTKGGWQLNIDNRLGRPRIDFAYWAPPLDDYLFVECDCIDVDRWIHVAAVVDVAVNLVTLYTDGIIGDQETRPSDIEPGDPTLYFGRWSAEARHFSGDLDDVALWSRALSAAEIGALQDRSPSPER
jgi:hypothetical protein